MTDIVQRLRNFPDEVRVEDIIAEIERLRAMCTAEYMRGHADVETAKLLDDIERLLERVRVQEEAIGRYEFWNEKMRKELERLGWEMP